MKTKWIKELEYANKRRIGLRFAEKPDPPQDILEIVIDDMVIGITPSELCDLAELIDSIKKKAFIEVMGWLHD